MRNLNKLWLSLAIILGFSVQITAQQNGVAVIPIYSTGDAPIYYYMESIGTTGDQPSGSTSSQYNLLYAQKDNNQMAKFALIGDIPSDIASTNKLWSLQKVNNKLVYKNYNGRYLNHDNSNNPAKVTEAEPATDIYAEGYPAAEYQFKIRVSSQNSPSIAWYKPANGNYLDRYSDQGASSRNAWYFVLPKDNLELAIANAQGYLTNTTEGDHPGQYSTTTRKTLSDAIELAEGQLDGTAAEKNAAGNTLNQAIKTYITTFNAPKVSTPGSEEYYYALKTTDRGNRLVTNNGLTNFITGNQYNDPSTVDNTPEKQRWMFVKFSDNTYALVNKSTGHYFNPTPSADNAEGQNKGFRPTTESITSAGWTLLYLKDVNKHHLVKGDNTQLHQSNSGNFSIINYYSLSDIGSNYAFIPLDYATEKAEATTLAGGDVADGDVINFTSSTPGAKFYYTLDGSTPNALSPIAVDNKITINHDLIKHPDFTLKVVTFANDYMNSVVAEANYNITSRTVYWRSEAGSGNWTGTGHWYYPSWNDKEQNRPDLPTRDIGGNNIVIDNEAHYNTMYMDGVWYNANSITFDLPANKPRIIKNDNNNAGVNFVGVNNTLVNNTSETQQFNTGFSMHNGSLTIDANAGDLVLNGIFWSGGKLMTVKASTGKTVTISGRIRKGASTGGSFTKVDPGTLVLSGDNGEYDGDFNVNEGVLVLEGNAHFSTSTNFLVKTGATMKVNKVLNLSNTTIQTGATLEVVSGAELTFGDNLNIQGEVIVRNGATLKIDKNFNLTNVTIENGGELEVLADKQLTAGTGVTNNGTIILNSGATLTGNVGGNATVKQSISPKRNWYMSSPVVGAGIPTYGDGTADGTKSIIEIYNEGETNLANSWVYVKETDGNFVQGKGYVVYPADGTDAYDFWFSGTLNNNDVSINITRTEAKEKEVGFNLVGNPYPSYINAKTLMDANTAVVLPTIWYRTATYNEGLNRFDYAFQTYNTESEVQSPDGLHLEYLPPMQAFWVRASVAGTFTFDKNNRLHKPEGASAFRAPKAVVNQILRLQLTNGTVTDEAVLYFNENAQNAFDNYDSPKMMNNGTSVPNIYTKVENENLVINGMNAIPYGEVIPLFVNGKEGNYTVSATEFSNFASTDKVELLDSKTGLKQDLSQGTYSFAVESGENLSSRFALVFPKANVGTGIDTQLSNGLFAFVRESRIVVNTTTDSGTIYVFNGVGQRVATQEVTGTVTELQTALPAGVYVVKLNNLTTKVVVR